MIFNAYVPVVCQLSDKPYKERKSVWLGSSWVSFLQKFYDNPSTKTALSFQYCIIFSIWIPLPSLLLAGPHDGFRMAITERFPEDMNMFISALNENNFWSPENSVALNQTIHSLKFSNYSATIYIQTNS